MDKLDIPASPEQEAKWDEQIRIALEGASDYEPEEIATTVRLDERNNLLIVTLLTGRRVAVPREDIQGLSEA